MSTISIGSRPPPTSPVTTRRRLPTGSSPPGVPADGAGAPGGALRREGRGGPTGSKATSAGAEAGSTAPRGSWTRPSIDCVEQGYLEYGLGMLRIFEAGDIAGRARPFRAGRQDRRTLRPPRARHPGPHRRGPHARSTWARSPRGWRCSTRPWSSIEAGELSPLAPGDAYCTVIDACAELFDLGRCRVVDRLVRPLVRHPTGARALPRPLLPAPRRGARAARRVARSPRSRLGAPAIGSPHPSIPAALGAASPIEGDLLASSATSTAREAAYVRASEFGHDPQPGLALLRLAQGRLDAADAMIRRALGEAEDPISRARLLGPYVEIVLAAGDTAAAHVAADELRRCGRRDSAHRSCERTRLVPAARCC